MKQRDLKLLQTADDAVKFAQHLTGSDDIHERYNSKDPDSLGVLIGWYYREAGQIIGGRKFDKKGYKPNEQ